ncbi:transcription elongation factor SPT6 homolog [Euphorbia lathyris]|uniref:transcription elongation factor SPT6 homolog n=1 Tax=Euphorbia lathyris TaxID=212925 RepID=UPI0033132122
MISGESEDTLAEGRIVQATVRRMEGGKAICMLYSELNGFLAMEYYADDWRDIPELSDGLHEGDESMEIIFKMVEENPWDVAHEMDELSVVYVCFWAWA